jgi:formylglycine-generating enzyme required for sulfatase activity
MIDARERQKAWAKHLGVPVEWKNAIGMVFVLIPPGEFMMGSNPQERARFLKEAEAARDQQAIVRIPSESPQHRVRISRPFYLGKYEVTQAQWQAVMGNNPSASRDNPLYPVERVSLDDIQPFLAKLNAAYAEQGSKYGLPTEAQWEFACRAGTTTAFCFGDNETMLLEYGWFKGNSRDRTNRVGQGRPNAWGMHDMHGNVWEWCADWHSGKYYDRSPSDDPVGPEAGANRVFRGGCWTQNARLCRSALRNGSPPTNRDGSIGLRLVLVLAEKPGE